MYPDNEILKLELLVEQVRERRKGERRISEPQILAGPGAIADPQFRRSGEDRRNPPRCEFAVPLSLDGCNTVPCGRKAVGTDLESETPRCAKHLS
jgi:hypothetical protein